MYHGLFHHSPTYGYLDCTQYFAITNTVNKFVYYIFVLLEAYSAFLLMFLCIAKVFSSIMRKLDSDYFSKHLYARRKPTL